MNTNFGGELAFLERMLATGPEQYRTADWLESDFDSMLWKCNFKRSGSFTLNFGFLIDKRAMSVDVARICKQWLIIASRPASEGLALTIGGQYLHVNSACAWIDYLVLNEKFFRFSKCGFSLLTPDAFQGALKEICNHAKRSTSIYRYEENVLALAQRGAEELGPERVKEILQTKPNLLEFADDCPRFGLLTEKIFAMRAWLHTEGFLQWNGPKKFKLDSSKVSTLLYSKTLRGVAASWPIVGLFSNYESRHGSRKYKAAPTSSKGQNVQASVSSENAYNKNIRAFGEMWRLDVVTDLLPPIQTVKLADAISRTMSGKRFKTLPAEVVFFSLRRAIEFCETNGDAIVDSYVSMLEQAKTFGLTATALSDEQVEASICISLRELGIRTWNGCDRTRHANARFADEDVAANHGTNLQRQLKVLYGATAVITGTLMARRQDELIKLDSEDALDSTGKYLIFGNAKSTRLLGGIREVEARPIIKVAAQAIRRLQRVHQVLRKLGYLYGSSELFQYPHTDRPETLTDGNAKNLNRCLDIFCDHIETPLKDGQRYYLRQHQLRRFFCMVFFWHRSFSGLDTLRWFLGHTDLEQIYRYITEMTPGAVLRHAKAQHAAENLSAHSNLCDYLKARFGTEIFTLLDTETLEAYIDILLEERNITIEPVFFQTADGKDYKIVVKVLDNGPKA